MGWAGENASDPVRGASRPAASTDRQGNIRPGHWLGGRRSSAARGAPRG